MSLESGTRIADLVATNPVGATDFASQGDDHIRLIKACLQGSFPSLGATAVTATGDELNKLAGATITTAELNNLHGATATTAEISGLHSLTASRAIVTTAGGILIASATTATEIGYVSGVSGALQTQIDAKLAISAAAAAYQPLDSDLTALAALTTTSFGRDFNTLADLAATATKLAALVPTWTGAHAFHGAAAFTQNVTMAAPTSGSTLVVTGLNNNYGFIYTAGATSGQSYGFLINAGTTSADNALLISDQTGATNYFRITGDGVTSVGDVGTLREAGFRHLPSGLQAGNYTLAATDNGKSVIYTGTGGHTFTGYAAADGVLITIINNGSTSVALAPGSGSLLWFGGTGSTPSGNRTLALGGVATFYRYPGGAAWLVWGTGIS